MKGVISVRKTSMTTTISSKAFEKNRNLKNER